MTAAQQNTIDAVAELAEIWATKVVDDPRGWHPSDLLCQIEDAIVLRLVLAGTSPADAVAEVGRYVGEACDNGLAALYVLDRYGVVHGSDWVPR